MNDISYTENGITFNLPGGTFSITPEGIEAKKTDGTVVLSLQFDISSGASFIKIASIADAYSSSNPHLVWKDSKGILRIGAAVAYTAADVGAVPTSRTVNGKALSANISLSASDVGAAASSHSHTPASIGALPDTTIQYFTQAQWAALTQAQKDAVPLALVQE